MDGGEWAYGKAIVLRAAGKTTQTALLVLAVGVLSAVLGLAVAVSLWEEKAGLVPAIARTRRA